MFSITHPIQYSQIYGDMEAAEMENAAQQSEEQYVFPRAFRFKKSTAVPFPRDFFKRMNNDDGNKYKFWNLNRTLLLNAYRCLREFFLGHRIRVKGTPPVPSFIILFIQVKTTKSRINSYLFRVWIELYEASSRCGFVFVIFGVAAGKNSDPLLDNILWYW